MIVAVDFRSVLDEAHSVVFFFADSCRSHVGIDANYIVSFAAGFALIGSFVFRVTRAAEMYMFLSDFEEFGKPINFEASNKFLDKLSKVHYVYLETLIIFIILVSNIFRGSSCEENNKKYDIDEICGLFSYIWLPFEIDYYPVKHIFLAVQVFNNKQHQHLKILRPSMSFDDWSNFLMPFLQSILF